MSTSDVTGLGAAGLGWTVEAQLTGGAALEDHRALAIFAGLADRSPLGLPAPVAVHARTEVRLQQAALLALDDYRDYGPADVP